MMGADQLDVDPELMRSSAGGMTSASDTLQTHFDGFQQDLAGQSDAFGDDDLGSLIGACYQAIHELAFGSYNDNNSAMRDHAQSVHDLADGYQQSEQASTGEVNDVRSVLG
jgi:uncharacterized protein YukE